jgi:hypothetical protein
MDPDIYQAPHLGTPVRVGRGEASYVAFAPGPIPRELELSADAVYELSEADRGLGALSP